MGGVMFYLLICFALNFCMQLQAADVPTHDDRWENKSVILQFPDDEDKILILPASTITRWSKTIRELVEDLGTDLPVPVPNVYQLSVECLDHLVTEKKDPLALLDFSSPLEKIKNHCALKLDDVKYRYLSRKDLLLQANYLDVPGSFKSALASFYATTLKTKVPNITKQIVGSHENIYFDEIPHELEPLIAQWLLHVLLREKPVEPTRSKIFEMHTESLIHGPFISHSSSPNGFACAWAEMGSGTRLSMRTQLNKLQQLDFYDENKCTQSTLLHSDINQYTHCALSPDARYTLMTINANQIYCGLHLRDQLTLRAQETSLYHKPEDIQAILYNSMTKIFNIIVYKKLENRAYKEALYVLNLDPARNNIAVDQVSMFNAHQNAALENSGLMDWSCIQGDLVGIHAPKSEKITALLYTNKQLFACAYNTHTELWTYTTDDDRKKIANFTVVHIGGMVTGKGNNAMAIERSTIPNFEQIICDSLPNMDIQQGNSWTMRFDPNNLYYNYLTTKASNTAIAKTKALFSPTLAAAIRYIDRKILEGDKRVLIDTYVLYHRVMNPHEQDKYCDHLYPYISAEIKKMLEVKL